MFRAATLNWLNQDLPSLGASIINLRARQGNTESDMFNIEVRECGMWLLFSDAPTLEEAIALAGSIMAPDEDIRIVTPDGKIL